jgi:esterase/lipase
LGLFFFDLYIQFNFMKLKIILGTIALLVLVYAFGPQPETPNYSREFPSVPSNASNLESYVKHKESRHHVKPGNEAKIIWANDSSKAKTEYALVYLHGFSASHHEGFPLHTALAEQFGCNLYLARLHDHGIDTTEALLNFTAQGFYNSALEALAIGSQLGEKVILIGTSTGCTAALKLAAEFPEVHAVINLSPNVRINDGTAFLLNNPWGLQIANLVLGDQYRYIDGGAEYAKFWNTKYRNEAIIELQELIETTMIPKTFEKIKQPVFNGFYYKNEQEQDPVVKVESIKWMHGLLATPENNKVLHPFPEAGNHVLASPIKSNDVEGVTNTVAKFMTDVLQMKPVSVL